MTIRTARAEDAAAIGFVHVRSWQAIYAGRFPQEFLDALDPVERGEQWAQYLNTRPHEREELLVVESAGEVVGFAGVGPSREEGAHPLEGEVRAIYLLPDRWSTGLGRELMEEALGRLSRFGYRESILWVLDANDRARRFYEAGGWHADGASKIDESYGFPVAEVRYRRQVA